jgi:hypothetical protein
MRILQLMMSYLSARSLLHEVNIRDDPSFMFPRFEMRIWEQEEHFRQLFISPSSMITAEEAGLDSLDPLKRNLAYVSLNLPL